MIPLALKIQLKRLDFKGLFKTIYHNFRLFPIDVAIQLPLVLSGRTKLICKRGAIILKTPKVRSAMLCFGVTHLQCSLPDYCSIIIGEGKLEISGNEYHNFASGTMLKIREHGHLSIGNRFSSGYGNKFFINSSSSFGEDNLLSWNCQFMDNDSHPILDSQNYLLNPSKGFNVGNNVWVGSNCTLLKGSSIPNGSIIASGSLISRHLIEPNAIYANSVVLKKNVFWKVQL